MDKQIIIDGIDVTDCEFCSRYADTTIYHCDWGVECKEYPNCHYKQLKRKEQELEQYKKSKQASYETMQREWNEAKNEVKKLKAENEELKKKLDFQKNMYECARADESDKFEEILELKQALQEIHKIANFTLWNYPTISDVDVYQNLEKILRIAENEVEDENI